MKPSLFSKTIPTGSVLQKVQTETIAMYIMEILVETGDVFREVDWKEYRNFRLSDINPNKMTFSEYEKEYFEEIRYLALGNAPSIYKFSPVWRDIYITDLEKKYEILYDLLERWKAIFETIRKSYWEAEFNETLRNFLTLTK